MKWKDYLTGVAGLMLIAELQSVWRHSAAIATALLVTITLAGTLVERRIRVRRFARLQGLDPHERDLRIESMPVSDAAFARLSFDTSFTPQRLNAIPDQVSFSYRAGSSSLNSFLFWGCIIAVVGMLIPVALGRFSDGPSMWVWIILAVIMGGAAYGYHLEGRDLGGVLTMDRAGISLERSGSNVQLGWLEIAHIRTRVAPGGLYRGFELCSQLGTCILIDTQTPRFWEIAELVMEKLVAVHPEP